jgi:ABC-2 type transport system ATP-binding protein
VAVTEPMEIPTADPGRAPAIVARDVWRSFGSTTVLSGLEFSASAGEVTGLVGPNGAGKTTLLLILATLLAPNRGLVRIGGHDPVTETLAVRKILGWVPDSIGFYDTLTAMEYLTFAGTSRRMSMAAARARAIELLELVHLTDLGARQVQVLSRGQKQRLGVASALVHRPGILLLDEPAAGLDPASRVDFLRLVRALASYGVAVVVSSHLLSDLEQMADRVVFIDQGVSVGERRVGERSLTTTLRRWRIHALDDAHLAHAMTAMGAVISAAGPGGLEVTLESDESAAGLLAALIGAGVPVVSCAPVESSLEAAYFELTEPA